ncbi:MULTISPECIES: serine/threonine protein kinase [unclassified Schlesneria]|uniref:serine/threonine protein kinase n=1 Tax=unclassified Schlesneria TaxID=2762017 RepID=UPI002F105F34
MHPDRIGPYLVEKRIGAGGMGNVYLARHKDSTEYVAVKELPASLAREGGFIYRFNREIEAMEKLNCRNIVKFYDSGSDGDTYYYAMEYVDGETLTAKLRREKRIPWRETIEIARQICAGLKHAHDAGVVHRDLKPSNLMLSKDGQVKITDFGVAQVFAAERLTATGGVIGTAEFMSPEQVKGSWTDKRSDLYSLGAVIYTMLVGQPPFVGMNATDIMQKQRFGRFDPPKNYVPEIPATLDHLVCQLLEKEPDKRLPDAFVTSKKLQEVLSRYDANISDDVVSPTDRTRSDSGDAHAAIGGELVRDIVKMEIANEPSLLGHVFNNTWVLLTLLTMIVAGVCWLLWNSKSPTESSEVEFTGATEAERIVQAARWRWKGGDPHAALLQLDALQAVIQGDPDVQSVRNSIERLRSAIAKQTKTPDQQEFVERALSRADGLPEDRQEEAREVYEGIILLYQGDKRLEAFVERARSKLKEISNSTP